jgi:glycerate kinase
MRILIACDSFKDALPAEDVCRAIARGLKRGHPGLDVTEMPLSDGGEGVLAILRRTLSLSPVSRTVADPLFRPVEASYGISADGATGVVEMAKASGLELLTLAERNPLLTSTFGTGELLADAKARGVTRVVLGSGGSATNDAGVGAAAALGWQFLDANGGNIPPLGGRLADIARIKAPRELPFAEVNVLCDVTNPLFGPHGAAFVYGKQKGGSEQDLQQLDLGLRHIARLVEEQLGKKGLADVPGAGSAGGFGFGAMAFLNAKLRRGIDMVMELAGFEAAAKKADLIITGEGKLDEQSMQGKLVQGVVSRAGKIPVIALCGRLSLTPEQVKQMGLKAAYSINPVQKPLAEMLAATAANLEETAAKLLDNGLLDKE